MFQAGDGVVVAREVRVVEEDGTIGTFGVSSGTARFLLTDASGRPRSYLSTKASGASEFFLAAADGNARVGADTDDDGNPSLYLRDATGRVRIGIDVDDNGTPIVALRDENDGNFQYV